MVGRRQSEVYARQEGKELRLTPSKTLATFRFGEDRHTSRGVLRVRVPVARDFFLSLLVDVVDLDIPFLIGLYTLDAHDMHANTVTNMLVCVNESLKVPLVRNLGQIYLYWGHQMLYTMEELQKVHSRFFHPKPERLFGVLTQAGDKDASRSTLEQLRIVSRDCDVCQRLSKALESFRVALPSEVIFFNRTFMLDLMWLDGSPALHVVYKDTLLSAACFLSKGETAKDVWDAYIRIWVTPYVGYSDTIHTDQGPQFVSTEWRSLLQLASIKRVESGVESHNALGAGERYHAFLRQIYRRERSTYPRLPKDEALMLAAWGMNQTAGTHGLTPTLLVFRIHPRMPVAAVDLPTQRERARATATARAEMARHVAKARLSLSLRARVPRAADETLRAGTLALVYREKPKDEWVGPFTIISTDNKKVSLEMDVKLRHFSVDNVKKNNQPAPTTTAAPMPPPTAVPATTPGSSAAETPRAATGMAPATAVPTDMGNIMDASIAADTLLVRIHSEVNKFTAMGELDEGGNGGADVSVLVTEILPSGEPRIITPMFTASTRKEVDGLRARNVWEVTPKSSLSPNANVVGGRFVHTIKHVGTSE